MGGDAGWPYPHGTATRCAVIISHRALLSTPYRTRPCPCANTGSTVSFGTSGREASTAAIDRGSSKGGRPSGAARPKAASSSAASSAP